MQRQESVEISMMAASPTLRSQERGLPPLFFFAAPRGNLLSVSICGLKQLRLWVICGSLHTQTGHKLRQLGAQTGTKIFFSRNE